MADYLRIATEEAYAPAELLERYAELLRKQPGVDPGFDSLWGFFLGKSERAQRLAARIQDLGEGRIRDMDEAGIAKQVLALTAPGVQVFDAPTATSLARSFNDQLAEAIGRHPERFAGLAAIAPQDPGGAARELERGVRSLGLKGAIVNAHTHGEYLDDQKFWEIFEAAEALDVPIYLHPTTPPPAMIGPFLKRGLDGAIYGFAVDTGLHMLRIIISGALDRFPRLRIVVGHLGEGIPYWLFRVDYMHWSMSASGRYPDVPRLRKKPSEYLRENFHVTTSGMAWEPAIMFAISVLGIDCVMYAMDYPYQYVPDEVKVYDSLPLGAADLKKFYQANAERVFAL
ncbi:MAG: amidohydrolase [Betaproteobacteria bacterium RIFCSPHIGHO2_12_FULL_69_13]|nr:MAG: amidohydrolase [Betaproteobacteria bacterium RIFCSPHIGHO2_12_FULL_69_13]OGA69287.1 MAG: amidohydrolase [Betaproteobacteria bacterium RIFCSPLOWO2_12_FULL_68_20]